MLFFFEVFEQNPSMYSSYINFCILFDSGYLWQRKTRINDAFDTCSSLRSEEESVAKPCITLKVQCWLLVGKWMDSGWHLLQQIGTEALWLSECPTATLQICTQLCQATARHVLYWWGAGAVGAAPQCRDAFSWEECTLPLLRTFL